MILDAIENISVYTGLSKNIKKAIEYISSVDLNELPLGKHEISGNEIFAIISEYSTKEENLCVTETHKKYIDIQIMLRGEENFGFAVLKDQEIIEPYNIEKDYIFYKAKLDYLLLRAGNFAIFFPNDMHCPGISSANDVVVKKAVIKVCV
jgi:YhcH/YjgK/YiaL family protein